MVGWAGGRGSEVGGKLSFYCTLIFLTVSLYFLSFHSIFFFSQVKYL